MKCSVRAPGRSGRRAMRLYLSSMDFGAHAERLVALAGRGVRAVIVMNALDDLPDERRHFLAARTRELEDLGFIADELDLRNWPTKSLDGIGLIWVNGGNTFLLRQAMVQSGFDSVVRTELERDALV